MRSRLLPRARPVSRTLFAPPATLAQAFFRLFNHPCILVAKCAGLLMQAIVEEGEPAVVEAIKQMALTQVMIALIARIARIARIVMIARRGGGSQADGPHAGAPWI
eukprot:4614-Prymnesium_polylepis.1